MTQRRVYLALSRAVLRALASGGSVPAGPARAVTPEVRVANSGLDEEGCEYVAFCDAVAAAGAIRERAGDRRIVAAADIDPDLVIETKSGDGPAGSLVQLIGQVPLRRIVSIHVDELEAAPDDELLWYDVTELDTVAALPHRAT